jgi:TonB family protein
VRYAAIFIIMLLLVASKPSHVSAMPGGEKAVDLQAASAEPNPDASGKYHLGAGVTAPKLLFAPDPEFTDEARHKRVEGVTVVSLTVDASGNPQDVRVARSMAEDVNKKFKHAAMGLDQNAVGVEAIPLSARTVSRQASARGNPGQCRFSNLPGSRALRSNA